MEAPSIRKPANPSDVAAATAAAPPTATAPVVVDQVLKSQEDVVRKFALALGKPKEGGLPRDTMVSLLAESVTDQDVALKIPSFDVKFSDEKNGESPLPNVGETHNPSPSPPAGVPTTTEPQPPQEETSSDKPTMSASVLTSATQEAADLEQKAARSLGSETAWTKSTLQYAKEAVVTNISDSFNRFIDSRLRAWTLLLLRHSLSTGDKGSRSRLLGILHASLQVASTHTDFKVIPMPPTASSRTAPDTIILPLLFQATVGISLKEKTESVTLRSPGTVAGTFWSFDHLILLWQ